MQKSTVKRCPVCAEALTGETKGLMVFIVCACVCVFFFFFSDKSGRLHKGTSCVATVRKRLGPKCTD